MACSTYTQWALILDTYHSWLSYGLLPEPIRILFALPSKMPLQVIVVGAGVGGLCAAVALHKAGHAVKVRRELCDCVDEHCVSSDGREEGS